MAYRSELPRICVALGCAAAAELDKLAGAACAQGEEFLELRLDALEEPEQGLAVIRRLRRRYPEVWLLATCRRKPNGGGFGGGVEEQLRLLEGAVEAGARAVDLEVQTAARNPELAAKLRARAKLIVSHHDFEATPALGPLLKGLRKIPADCHKLVTTARKPTDNWRVLELAGQAARQEGGSLVALAMGLAGVPSRLLALARGAAFTYAAAGGEGQPTAPGQVASRAMRRQYRVERHTADTEVYGVIANPVGHSISPAVHNRAFHARRVDAIYVPFQVEERQVGDFVALAGKLPVAGFSVTIPHKQRILRYLDAMDAPAHRIGAVNTVYRRQGRLRGTNTDAAGVTAPLEKRRKLKNAKVLVAGNGGAARAAVFAVAERGARVWLTGRNPARVRALARLCGATPIDRERLGGVGFDVLIHATPLGMSPRAEECFFPDAIPGELVFDLVYNPQETLLLRRAGAAGKQVIAGLEMFLEQAAAQFEIWTGMAAPRMAMEAAAREALCCNQT